ncbi:MAG: PAS domain S-box protein [Ignavibacteria bacterium]|nr:PAS domain S-box protein [Ignavibacteria bacterium]
MSIGKNQRKAFKSKSPKYTSPKSHLPRIPIKETKFLRSFYAEPLVASIISASTGKYIDVNIRFEEFFGLSRKDVIGKSPLELDIWAKKSHRKKAAKDFLQEGSFGKFSLRVIAAGGKIADVFAVSEVINFKGEDCYLGRLYDITGQIEASKKLKEGEQKFSNLVENSLDVIYEFDIKHHCYKYISPSSKEILGIKPEVFLRKKSGVILSLILGEDRNEIIEHNKMISASRGPGKKSFYIEYRIKYGKKDLKWLADNRTVIYDNNGRPESMIGNITDVTYRKNAQEELLKSYELQKGYLGLLTTIQDALPAYVAMLDKTGTIVTVNESWSRFDAGSSLVHKSHTAGINYISVCDNARCMCSNESRKIAVGIKKVLKGVLEEFQTEYPCHFPDKQRWYRLLVSPIGKTKPTGAVVMHIDITEQKLADLSLEDSETQYRLLFHNNPLPMFIYDVDTMMIVAANNAAIRHYGYSRREILKLSLHDIRTAADRAGFTEHWEKETASNRKCKSANVGIWKHLKKNGEIIDVDITRACVNFEGKKAILILAEDVTERLKSERSFKKKKSDIELLYKAGKELSGTLDLHKILDKIYRIVKENLQCDSMIISSYNNKEKEIKCLAAWQEDVKQDVSKLPPLNLAPKGLGIQSEIIRTRKAKIVKDYERYTKNCLTRLDYNKHGEEVPLGSKTTKVNNSALLVPLKLEGKVIGVVQVLSCEHNAYTTDDLKMLEALLSQLSAAMANAKLYQQAQLEISEREKAQSELKKKKDEVTILYNAERELASSLDTNEVYDKIYRIVSELIPCESMVISSFEKTSSKINCLAAWIKDKKLDNSKFPELLLDKTGKGFQSRVIITGKSLIVDNFSEYAAKNKSITYVYKDNTVKKDLTEGDKINRSALLVPMMLKGNAIGVIQVLSYRKNIYTQAHLRVLEALSAQISAATANAKLYSLAQTEITERKKAEEAFRRKSNETSVLYEAQKELSKTLDLNSVYNNSYRIISGLMPCDTMMVSSYDKKDNMIRVLSVWTEGHKPALKELPPIPLAPKGYGIQSNVIHTGESLLILDYKSYFKKSINKYTFTDDKLDKNIKSIYSSAMIVPMKVEGSVIGTIQVLSFKKDAYTENDLRMLETLTTHITAATANAELYQQAQSEILERTKAEKQLRERTDEITLLYESYRDLTSTLDTKVIYGKVYDVIRKIMPCDAMSIISMEKISGDMKFVSLWQDDICHDTTNIPMMKYNPENKGIITELIKTGEPRIYNNYYDVVQKNPSMFAVDNKGEISKQLSEEDDVPITRSAILVPMKIENSIIGVITVYSYEKEAYKEENLKILEALTTELSAATLNAMLYQQAQKEIEERIRNEEELTIIKKNLEEAQRIAHIGSWFFDIESNMMTNSDEVYTILGIKPTPEGFEFDQAMNFVHDDDRKQTMKNIKDAIKNKKSYVNEDRIIRPDGEVRYVKLMGEPAFDDKGNYKGIHGTIQDITEIKLINGELMRSLSEKEMMLKEIHHRVKNNLQVVSSLLRLQSDKISDRTAIDYLKQSEQRVKSMALIHQQLYRTKDLSKIDFREYLKELCSYLIFAYGVNSQKISLQIELDETYFGIDTALPCGLIVNELLTNSIKHAYPGNRTGNIVIKLYKDDSNTNHLTVKDDGIGGKLDFKNAETLGLELVSTLTEQLDGEITSCCNGGTEITISFADQKNKSTN